MFLKYNIYTILWAIIILISTLTPGNAMPSVPRLGIPESDKIAHFFVFSVFAFLLIYGFKRQFKFKQLKKNALTFSLFIAFFFGLLIEYMQENIPGRGFEVMDILANFSGIVAGLGIYYLRYKY